MEEAPCHGPVNGNIDEQGSGPGAVRLATAARWAERVPERGPGMGPGARTMDPPLGLGGGRADEREGAT